MNRKDVLNRVDHTLLSQTATWEQIRQIIDDGIKYETASVCIPPSYVRQAADYAQDRITICTVIGFPNGYNTTMVKACETEDALKNGAEEIDMVINLGWVKDGRYADLENEIRTLKSICGDKILKVIIETCLLTREEKIRMCQIVTAAGADYIKTSTGFSTGGATPEDVSLMRANVGAAVKVKAAGGISGFADAEELIKLGADRLGTSRLVKSAKAEE